MGDVIPVAESIINSEDEPDCYTLFRNEFVNVLTFHTKSQTFLSLKKFSAGGEGMEGYNFEDDVTETMQDLYEVCLYLRYNGRFSCLTLELQFYLSAYIFSSLVENAACEQGQRMVSMESATNNATELYDKLSLQYNKGRQASITKELIEIVSGQEALATEEEQICC